MKSTIKERAAERRTKKSPERKNNTAYAQIGKDSAINAKSYVKKWKVPGGGE